MKRTKDSAEPTLRNLVAETENEEYVTDWKSHAASGCYEVAALGLLILEIRELRRYLANKGVKRGKSI